MNRDQILALTLIICGTLILLCLGCAVISAIYFQEYFSWLDRFLNVP
jgi:hypothetical protein